jgi:hypothetical protein
MLETLRREILVDFSEALSKFMWIIESQTPFECADIIAEYIKNTIGLIVIDSAYFNSHNHFMTIMDYLEESDELDPVLSWILSRSFKRMGFKYAFECEMLSSMYAIHAIDISLKTQ